jgi:hypothetical protein
MMEKNFYSESNFCSKSSFFSKIESLLIQHQIGNAKFETQKFLRCLTFVELIKEKKLSEKTLLLNLNQQKGLFTKFFLLDKFDRKPDNEEIFAFPILLFHRF